MKLTKKTLAKLKSEAVLFAWDGHSGQKLAHIAYSNAVQLITMPFFPRGHHPRSRASLRARFIAMQPIERAYTAIIDDADRLSIVSSATLLAVLSKVRMLVSAAVSKIALRGTPNRGDMRVSHCEHGRPPW